MTLPELAYQNKLLAQEDWLLIIVKLSEKVLTVNELVEATEIEQSLLSHHLRDMKARGYVLGTRRGQCIEYCLRKNEVVGLALAMIGRDG